MNQSMGLGWRHPGARNPINEKAQSHLHRWWSQQDNQETLFPLKGLSNKFTINIG